jgi:preprotein translocase subunit SecF
MLNIIGKRYYYFAFSLFIIVPGMIILFTRGIPLAIDFTGGTLIEVRFESGNVPLPAEVVSLYNDLGVDDILVQTTGEGTLVARSSFLDDQTRAQIIDTMEKQFSDTVVLLRLDSVGPIIGQEVAGRAFLAVSVAAAIVVFYIAFAFRGVQNAFRYGICAIIAMVHDVLIVISITAIGSVVAGWQIDALYLTALLTVIGFSAQDTIVVFDRIRENSNIFRRLEFETLVNHSIVQTLERSINTQLMTVEFILLALVLFGGITLREFALVMLVGLISGTYSSIFIAAPSLVVWQNHEWRNWFRRGQAQAST